MSILTVSYLVGLGAGVPLGGWATEAFSVRAAFVMVAILFVLTSVAAVLLVPRPERQVPVEPEERAGLIEGELRVVTHTEHDEGPSLAGFMESLRRAPHLLIMAVIVFLGIGLLYQTAPLIARREFRLDPLTYGKLFVIPAAIIGVLTVPLGRLGDRWGPPRSVHLGLALAAAALWALALLPKTQLLLVVGASVLGIGSVIVVPAWLAVISSVADPQHRGAMIGAVATAQGIGAFLGVLIGPLLFKAVRLAAFLAPSWPGGPLTPYLLPVIGAAVLVTITWLASLVVVRVHQPVRT
jgi:MFS family permease